MVIPEHDDLSGDGLYVGDNVGGQQYNPVLRQGVDEVPEPDPFPGVQPGGGLVQDQQSRIIQHGSGDPHPLDHAAGELLELSLSVRPQPHQLQEATDASLRLPLRDALERGHIPQELSGGVIGIVPELLGEISQQPPVVRPQGQNVLSVPEDLSLCGKQERRQHFHQGGLSGTVGSQQSVDAGRKRQGDVLQSREGSILLCDMFN